MDDCPEGAHAWESKPPFSDHPEYISCERCQALATRKGNDIVVVKCSENGCQKAAITLCADLDYKPVCSEHFIGVISI
jgi:hypothetical protein